MIVVFFCEREKSMFIWRARVIVLGGAGCTVATRSHFDALLSCLTTPRVCHSFAALQRRGLLCDEVWVCAMFTYSLSQWVPFFKQAKFLLRQGFSCSYPHFFSFLLQIFLPFFLSILHLSILLLYIIRWTLVSAPNVTFLSAPDRTLVSAPPQFSRGYNPRCSRYSVYSIPAASSQ